MIKLAWALIKLSWRALRLALTIRKVLRSSRVRRGRAGRCKWDPDFARREAARAAMLTGAHEGWAMRGRTGAVRAYFPEPVEGGLPWGQYLTCGPAPLGVKRSERAHPGLAHLYLAEDGAQGIAAAGKSALVHERLQEMAARGRKDDLSLPELLAEFEAVMERRHRDTKGPAE